MDFGVIVGGLSLFFKGLGLVNTAFTAGERFRKLSESQRLQAKRIAARLKKASKKKLTRSSSPEEKETVQQAVKAALETFDNVRKDSKALVQARRGRDAFLAYVNENGGTQRREALDEDVRGLFDELLVIVADGVHDLAETNSGLVPQALTDLLNDTQILLGTLKTIETTAGKTLEAVNVGNAAADERYIETRSKLDNISGLINEHLAGRKADCERKVRFGSLPAQAVGFVDRREQADLYEALTKPEPADSAGKRETSQLALDDPQARGSNADNNADHSTDGAGGGSPTAGDGVSSSSDGAGRAANGSGSSTNGVGSSPVGGPVVVCGMRGVGKSQLAAAYARDCEKAGWSLVAWMDASSREALVAGLAGLAVEMGIDDGKGDPDAAACRCVTRLNSGEGDRLLVFDNVEDFDDLTGLVPRSDGLRVLVTTTVASPGDSAGRLIAVGAFTRPQSVDFIRERTGLDEADGPARLAEALGDLPVALAQAAATIKLNGYATIDEYLADLRKYRLEEVVDRASGEAYPSAVHAALRMACTSVLDLLAERDHARGEEGTPKATAASVQLATLALLAPSGVPRPWLHRVGNSEPIARQAVGALVAHSVCTLSDDGRYVRIHGLQGRVLREDYMRQPEVFADLEGAVVDLLKGIDMDKADTDNAQRTDALDMADQLRAIAEQQQGQAHYSPHEAHIDLSSVVDIVNNTIYCLPNMGRPQTALTLKDAVDMLTDALGPDHPHTLTTRNNLATAHHAAGHLSTAIDMHQDLLADRTRVLGPEHPDTLVTRGDLAVTYRDVGNIRKALDMHQALLADRTRVLGPEHPDTLVTRSNLAITYQRVGNVRKALDMHQAVLVDRTRVLGPDHPDTLITRNNLATAHQQAGHLSTAIDMHQDLLSDRTRILGPDHPRTLITRNNLAIAYRESGNLQKAIDMFEDVLTDRTRILGPDHPHTLTTRGHLAIAYRESGNLQKAIDMFEDVLTDRTRILGPDHPHTLTTRGHLAIAYRESGNLQKAIDMFEDVLTDRTRILGPDHPHTLTTRRDLAVARLKTGNAPRAMDMLEALFPHMEQILGPDHPDTLTTRNNLAYTHEEAGHLSTAIAMYEDVLADRTRVLGPDHPDTLGTRINLARAHQEAGNVSTAIAKHQALLTDCTRVLGPDHPYTLGTRINLAGAHYAAGDLQATIDTYEALLPDLTRVFGPDHPYAHTTRNNLAAARKKTQQASSPHTDGEAESAPPPES